ncbi:hypothetical protein KC678_00545 [Candidatus Dojkabacteria bacterium]|uniref:Prepilin-type N-terminal cleavage/methylation domain-containing protein n=1 Tax=Candidatus Dojkabacteria bacterium TaxID=2099670 RepID=A0A955IC72_9BACT|nr:hypothetical protein [Candidatus Dojkabacteria bacterium]
MKDINTKKGFALVEIILAVGLFAIVFTSIALFSVDSLRSDVNQRTKTQAQMLVQETIQGLKILKNNDWRDILSITDTNPRHIEVNGNQVQIVNGELTVDDITVSFIVDQAQRDVTDEFVTSGGTLDSTTKMLTVTAQWNNIEATPTSIESSFFLNSWQTSDWVDSLESEFQSGTPNAVAISNDFDGEVELESQSYSNWCQPELTQTVYDIPGSGIPTIVSSIPGKAFLGSTSYSLQNLLIDHTTDPAGVTIEAEFNGYSTKAIYGDESYTYLATTNDNKEIVILDTDTAPYTEVGYFNASGSTDATSVAISGNVGFMAQGRTFRSFDLSSKTGSRPQLDSINTGLFFNAYISEIEIRGNYAFVSLYNDWWELAIIDISDPSNLSVTKYKELNYSQSSDLFVSDDGNRVFIGTTYSSSWDEFFILDTTNKSGSLPILDSYDTGNMSVTGNTVIDNRAIIVGYNGQEYQVLDITDINNVQYCGGLDVPAGLNGVTSIRDDASGDVFSYVIGNSSTEEFRVIKGGLGSGGGSSYADSGDFTSRIFDTTYANPSYYLIQWSNSQPANTNLQIQVRAGDQPDLSDGTWVGPDDTGSTYFTNGEGEILPDSLQEKQYFQYKVFFESDGSATPILEDVTLLYTQ